jgi:hypothetical protein
LKTISSSSFITSAARDYTNRRSGWPAGLKGYTEGNVL